MTKKERIIELLFDQRKPDTVVGEDRLKLLLNPGNPGAEVDWDQVQDVLGFSSMQALAFLNSVNAEFGANLTADTFANNKSTGRLFS